MGYRSLIEINHDTVHRLKDDPAGFVDALILYASSGSAEQHSGNDFQAVAMRHSSDNYIISNHTRGFPANLPYAEQVARREEVVSRARALLPDSRGNSKARLLDTIAELLDIIEVAKDA